MLMLVTCHKTRDNYARHRESGLILPSHMLLMLLLLQHVLVRGRTCRCMKALHAGFLPCHSLHTPSPTVTRSANSLKSTASVLPSLHSSH